MNWAQCVHTTIVSPPPPPPTTTFKKKSFVYMSLFTRLFIDSRDILVRCALWLFHFLCGHHVNYEVVQSSYVQWTYAARASPFHLLVFNKDVVFVSEYLFTGQKQPMF